MTPAQCRAARALLEITQSELAAKSRLGLSTVVDFEKGRRQVSDDAIRAMQTALERSGIEFNENGAGIGLTRMGFAETVPIITDLTHVGYEPKKRGLLSSTQIRAARALLKW